MEVGTRVEVRSRFEASWVRGFEVAEVVEQTGGQRYRLRRRSDDSLLPVLFGPDDLREERRKATWWL